MLLETCPKVPTPARYLPGALGQARGLLGDVAGSESPQGGPTARLTGSPAVEVMLLPPGGPARVVVRSGDGHDLSHLDGALAEVGRWRSGDDIRLIPRSTWVATYHAGEAAVIDLLSPGTTLWRGASPAPIHHAVPFDATGDGSPALIFGLDAPKFGLQRLDGLGGARAAPRIAHRATDGSDSVLTAFVVDDLARSRLGLVQAVGDRVRGVVRPRAPVLAKQDVLAVAR